MLLAPMPAPGTGPKTLVVGDDRRVELINPGGARTDALRTRIGAAIGGAVDAVDAFWGPDWPHHLVVVLTGTQRRFRDEAGGGAPGQWADVAAVTVADAVDPAHRRAVGQRIVFAPGAAAMSAAALQIVLGHELFHYAARADTALDAPRWLTEGVADFVARPAPVPRTAPPAALPSDADLDAAGPRRRQAYERAWWFARFVAEDFGAAKLRELYLAACGTGHADPASAMRAVLGMGPPGLLAAWQRWLTR